MDETKSSKATYSLDYIRLNSDSGCDVHYSVFYEGLPENFRLIAQRKLNETEENKQKALEELKAFLKKEKLTCTEDDLIAVLRCTKYNLKKADLKLKSFLHLRRTVSQWLTNLDESKIKLILDDMSFGVLPYRDKYGRVIGFAQPTLRLDLYDMEDLKPLVFALILYVYSFPLTTVAGFSYIGECKTDSLHMLWATAKFFLGAINSFVDVPMRHGRFDLTNGNFIVRWTYTVMRPFLSGKLKTRVFFHDDAGDFEALKNVYHPDLLPEEFGGNLGPITNKFYREGFLNFIQKLKSQT